MAEYNFNPDACLQVLHGIAEEIPLGVSGKDLKEIYPKIKFSQELVNYMETTATTSAKNSIDWLWERYSIPEKLKHLKELEENSPKTDAWRPKTGQANLNSIIATNLLERKKKLLEQIELIREESNIIVPYLKEFSEQCREQVKEMDAIEEKHMH